MQIFVRLLIVTSLLGFHMGFHKFIIRNVEFVDFVPCLKHLALDYELLLLGRLKEVNRILGLFLLFGLGLTFLFSYNLRSGLVRFLCCLSGKSGNSNNVFCSKNVIDGKFSSPVPFIDEIEMEKIQKLNSCTDVDGETDSDNGDDVEEKEKEDKDEDTESDISKLRELLKIEHQKVNAVRAELAEERAAAATAAEEAMAMILRLQREKSLLEMEWSQYRRLAEEKQIHDQQVIRSLQWLVWQHEFNRSLLEDEEDDGVRPQPATPCRYKVKEEDCFNGNILDALENVLYSSRDSDCFLSA